MPTDIRGVEIEVGDTVAYPGRSGSNMWLTVTTIYAFGTGKEYKYNYETRGGTYVDVPVIKGKTARGKHTHTRKLGRVVIVQKGNVNV